MKHGLAFYLLTIQLFLPALAAPASGGPRGIPVHVDDPTSTTPNPPLRKFLPSTNPYARRLLTEKFVLVDDLQKVDRNVLRIFHEKIPVSDIANRGERFNPTDVSIGPHVPYRRFVLSGSNSTMCLILYEVGGIGYHHNLIVFSKDKDWSAVAAVTGTLKENSFESLKESVGHGKFFDQPGHRQY